MKEQNTYARVIMDCIVHYENQLSYTDIKRYNDVNLTTIKETKLERLGLDSNNTNKVGIDKYQIYLIHIFTESILSHVTLVKKYCFLVS